MPSAEKGENVICEFDLVGDDNRYPIKYDKRNPSDSAAL